MHDIYKLPNALANGTKVLNQHMGQEIDFRAVPGVSLLLWCSFLYLDGCHVRARCSPPYIACCACFSFWHRHQRKDASCTSEEVLQHAHTLLGKGLAIRFLAMAHHDRGAPLLYSSGALKQGAPLLADYQWRTSIVVRHY
jgi:hypothetical protein